MNNSTVTCEDHMVVDPIACAVHGSCLVVNATYSSCSCDSGKKGPVCDQLVVPLASSYAICAILFVLIIFVALYFMCSPRYRARKMRAFQTELLLGVTPSHPKVIGDKMILALRVVVFGWFFGTHVYDISDTDGTLWIYFTTWNFIVCIIYFAFGIFLSGLVISKGGRYEAVAESPFASTIAKIHYGLLEFELPMTILVDVMLWGILYTACPGALLSRCLDPTATAPVNVRVMQQLTLALINSKSKTGGCQSLVNYSGFIVHGAQFFAMSADFLLTKHSIRRDHVWLVLAWASIYGIFEIIWCRARDATVGHAPVYFFLSMATSITPAWVIGVGVLHVVFYMLVNCVSRYALKRKETDGVEEEGGESKEVAVKVEDATPAAGNDV